LYKNTFYCTRYYLFCLQLLTYISQAGYTGDILFTAAYVHLGYTGDILFTAAYVQLGYTGNILFGVLS